MSQMDELEFARHLVHRASFITNWFKEKRFNILRKRDKTPVTLADLSSQIYMQSQIKLQFPEYGIISEEDATHLGKNMKKRIKKSYKSLKSSHNLSAPEASSLEQIVNYEGNLNSEYLWSIDPIDGTKGYVRDLSYAIGVCLFKNYEPYICAVGVPKYKGKELAIFSAQRGEGAWRSNDNIHHKRIKVSEQKKLSKAKITRSLHHVIGWEKDFLTMAGITSDMQMDGMGKGALVADGSVDIYFRPYPTKVQSIWDVGPIDLLIREAGGKVRDFHGNRLRYEGKKCVMDTYGYFATNPYLEKKVLEVLQNKKIKKKIQ